jgi:hypothetical protein
MGSSLKMSSLDRITLKQMVAGVQAEVIAR